MAISAISPISSSAVFIQPLAQLRQLNTEQAFTTALTNSLNGIQGSPAALRAASSQTQLVSSLEQALFNQWVNSMQSADAGALGGTLDSLLARSLGITGSTSTDTSKLPFDTNNPQSLLLATRLVSLFNTADLLGSDTGQGSQLGSLLDILA